MEEEKRSSRLFICVVVILIVVALAFLVSGVWGRAGLATAAYTAGSGILGSAERRRRSSMRRRGGTESDDDDDDDDMEDVPLLDDDAENGGGYSGLREAPPFDEGSGTRRTVLSSLRDEVGYIEQDPNTDSENSDLTGPDDLVSDLPKSSQKREPLDLKKTPDGKTFRGTLSRLFSKRKSKSNLPVIKERSEAEQLLEKCEKTLKDEQVMRIALSNQLKQMEEVNGSMQSLNEELQKNIKEYEQGNSIHQIRLKNITNTVKTLKYSPKDIPTLIQQLHDLYNETRKNNVFLRTQINTLYLEKTDMTADIEKLRSEIQQMEEKVRNAENLSESMEQCEESVRSLERHKRELTTLVNSLKREVEEATHQKDIAVAKSQQPYQQDEDTEIYQLQQQQMHEQVVQEYNEGVERMVRKLEECSRLVDKTQENLNIKTKELETLQQKYSNLISKCGLHERKIEELLEKIREKDTSIEKLKQTIEDDKLLLESLYVDIGEHEQDNGILTDNNNDLKRHNYDLLYKIGEMNQQVHGLSLETGFCTQKLEDVSALYNECNRSLTECKNKENEVEYKFLEAQDTIAALKSRLRECERKNGGGRGLMDSFIKTGRKQDTSQLSNPSGAGKAASASLRSAENSFGIGLSAEDENVLLIRNEHGVSIKAQIPSELIKQPQTAAGHIGSLTYTPAPGQTTPGSAAASVVNPLQPGSQRPQQHRAEPSAYATQLRDSFDNTLQLPWQGAQPRLEPATAHDDDDDDDDDSAAADDGGGTLPSTGAFPMPSSSTDPVGPPMLADGDGDGDGAAADDGNGDGDSDDDGYSNGNGDGNGDGDDGYGDGSGDVGSSSDSDDGDDYGVENTTKEKEVYGAYPQVNLGIQLFNKYMKWIASARDYIKKHRRANDNVIVDQLFNQTLYLTKRMRYCFGQVDERVIGIIKENIKLLNVLLNELDDKEIKRKYDNESKNNQYIDVGTKSSQQKLGHMDEYEKLALQYHEAKEEWSRMSGALAYQRDITLQSIDGQVEGVKKEIRKSMCDKPARDNIMGDKQLLEKLRELINAFKSTLQRPTAARVSTSARERIPARPRPSAESNDDDDDDDDDYDDVGTSASDFSKRLEQFDQSLQDIRNTFTQNKYPRTLVDLYDELAYQYLRIKYCININREKVSEYIAGCLDKMEKTMDYVKNYIKTPDTVKPPDIMTPQKLTPTKRSQMDLTSKYTRRYVDLIKSIPNIATNASESIKRFKNAHAKLQKCLCSDPITNESINKGRQLLDHLGKTLNTINRISKKIQAHTSTDKGSAAGQHVPGKLTPAQEYENQPIGSNIDKFNALIDEVRTMFAHNKSRIIVDDADFSRLLSETRFQIARITQCLALHYIDYDKVNAVSDRIQDTITYMDNILKRNADTPAVDKPETVLSFTQYSEAKYKKIIEIGKIMQQAYVLKHKFSKSPEKYSSRERRAVYESAFEGIVDTTNRLDDMICYHSDGGNEKNDLKFLRRADELLNSLKQCINALQSLEDAGTDDGSAAGQHVPGPYDQTAAENIFTSVTLDASVASKTDASSERGKSPSSARALGLSDEQKQIMRDSPPFTPSHGSSRRQSPRVQSSSSGPQDDDDDDSDDGYLEVADDGKVVHGDDTAPDSQPTFDNGDSPATTDQDSGDGGQDTGDLLQDVDAAGSETVHQPEESVARGEGSTRQAMKTSGRIEVADKSSSDTSVKVQIPSDYMSTGLGVDGDDVRRPRHEDTSLGDGDDDDDDEGDGDENDGDRGRSASRRLPLRRTKDIAIGSTRESGGRTYSLAPKRMGGPHIPPRHKSADGRAVAFAPAETGVGPGSASRSTAHGRPPFYITHVTPSDEGPSSASSAAAHSAPADTAIPPGEGPSATSPITDEHLSDLGEGPRAPPAVMPKVTFSVQPIQDDSGHDSDDDDEVWDGKFMDDEWVRFYPDVISPETVERRRTYHGGQ